MRLLESVPHCAGRRDAHSFRAGEANLPIRSSQWIYDGLIPLLVHGIPQIEETSSKQYVYKFKEMISFLGPLSNVSTVPNETLASAELRAFDQEFLVMDVGPGVCAYK